MQIKGLPTRSQNFSGLFLVSGTTGNQGGAGNLADPTALFKAVKFVATASVWGVFGVQHRVEEHIIAASEKAVKIKALRIVGTNDSGRFVAFMVSESWRGRAVSLAGHESTVAQMVAVFERVVSWKPARSYKFVTWVLLALVKETSTMFKWIYDVGHAVDVTALKKENPVIKGFETWWRTESQFKKSIKA
ncbi:hypothetical protein Cob_v008122 [Colletotrichum orbiculare MAFF 240422]|uniref:NmrA-like domain-containing protein n=1 Tax=Colletotrichum orbiculare (strain 104-T / ATCC 96160 / CBS 514.97 / LARS 414 / MAFF 240422) TaxID=1213857 RepID=A0A484FNH4_COLOR|nr:hypothetical protein Cob_v008122 [Colletotrichum orbiculare MAFF 240422]